ncbi:MAG: hypothetical protein ACTSVE_09045 [Candidatus Helarchaeota archaeon]
MGLPVTLANFFYVHVDTNNFLVATPVNVEKGELQSETCDGCID